MNHRYYCIMRPPVPGAIPMGAVDVCWFGERQYVPEIDRMAWGWAEYAEPLPWDAVSDYELISAPVEV